jgi:hypothetical protein
MLKKLSNSGKHFLIKLSEERSCAITARLYYISKEEVFL